MCLINFITSLNLNVNIVFNEFKKSENSRYIIIYENIILIEQKVYQKLCLNIQP